jgi:hypothetical protein
MTTVSLNELAAARMMRRDPPRSEPKVPIVVESRGYHAICGHALSPGKQTLEVYASDVDAFRAEVEDADLAPSKRRLAQLEDLAARAAKGETVAAGRLPPWPLSLEAVFNDVEMRGIRPLISVKRADDKTDSKRT